MDTDREAARTTTTRRASYNSEDGVWRGANKHKPLLYTRAHGREVRVCLWEVGWGVR